MAWRRRVEATSCEKWKREMEKRNGIKKGVREGIRK